MVRGMEAQIIPRKEHCISRKQVSPNALRTLYRLYRHGFIACLVGGCVRDLLLRRTPKDFDIGTNATPRQIKRLFRNCFLIGRRFRLVHLRFQDEIVEVSTFRRDAVPSDTQGKVPDKRPPRHSKDDDGMVLRDNVFGTLEEDVLRRDFTINALVYDIADCSVIDYTGGLSDLQKGIIRPIGNPRVRFEEDPVRMLRAVRFSASHGFGVDPAAWEILCELSSTISRVSPFRVYEEIQKLFLLGSARPAFTLLKVSGLLAGLFPSLCSWICGESGRLAFLDTNLGRLDEFYRNGTPLSPALFLAALFGPSLEESALARHRNGISYRQALDATCATVMKEISTTVSIPRRVGGQLRAILGLQASLKRTPPQRPASVVVRPEFKEALAYLRIAAETRREERTPLQWWDQYLLEAPSVTPSRLPADQPAPERRRRIRRKRRRARQTAA